MTPYAARVAVLAGALITVVGIAAVLLSAVDYLGGAMAISSTSGNMVFSQNGQLVSFAPYEGGFPTVILGVGIVVLVGATLVAAATWRDQPAD